MCVGLPTHLICRAVRQGANHKREIRDGWMPASFQFDSLSIAEHQVHSQGLLFIYILVND